LVDRAESVVFEDNLDAILNGDKRMCLLLILNPMGHSCLADKIQQILCFLSRSLDRTTPCQVSPEPISAAAGS
jgi:hypothetical protein